MDSRRARLAARRVRETLTTFDNGGTVLLDMARRADELTYRVGASRVVAPNVGGARVPLYEVFAEDEYDLDWFTSGLGDAPTFVDVGAHIGCFVVDLMRRFPAARGVAFEPTPSTGAYLTRNVELNGLTGRVQVRHEAVSATTGMLEMADNGVGSGHNGVLHLAADGSNAIEVRSESFGDVVTQLGAVDLVKMDCEGGEYDIVLGTTLDRWADVRRVVMEYHALPGHEFAEIEHRLAEAGLDLARRHRYNDGLGLAWFSREPL